MSSKTKVDIVILVPIGSTHELYLADEIVRDFQAYYIKHTYHIIFIDDTESFEMKNFSGESFTTIWSGCQGVRNNINASLLDKEKTIFFTVTSGVIYAYHNFEFDFLQYIETDCALVNRGLDEWLYNTYKKYKFDLIGPLDDAGYIYEQVINIEKYRETIPCFQSEGQIIYVTDEDVYKFPVMFFAIHFLSYSMIKKMVELDKKFAFLRSLKLMRSCNTVSTEPHFTTIVRLIGGRIVFWGGMDQMGNSGKAKPPLLSFHPDVKRLKHCLIDAVKNFKIVHSLKNFEDFSFMQAREWLSERREHETATNSNINLMSHNQPRYIETKREDLFRSQCETELLKTQGVLLDTQTQMFQNRRGHATKKRVAGNEQLRKMQYLLIKSRWQLMGDIFRWQMVLVYGAGQHTADFITAMQARAPRIQGFIDNNTDLHGHFINDIKIYAPSD